MFLLMGSDGWIRASKTPGKLGGHRQLKIYGRLDCPSALRFIAAGHYVKHRVFFKDEATAIAAGFRPCAKCLPEKYKEWKSARG
jgi:methylphosphotriester-DNA--protein-cysteine methyltransferase